MSLLTNVILHPWMGWALPKLKVMLLLCWITIIACACFGCTVDGPRCLNPGADWTITVANRHDLTAEFIKRGGDYIPNAQVQHGFTDREKKEMWVVGTPADIPVLRAFAHELLIHGPQVDAAARIYSPRFDVFYMDAPAETRAAAMALAEARRRQLAVAAE